MNQTLSATLSRGGLLGIGIRSLTCLCTSPLAASWSQNKNSEYCAPLTSFDWNKDEPSLLGTACIDTTCTIWDVTTQQAKTQIIAHDKEVYDIGEQP